MRIGASFAFGLKQLRVCGVLHTPRLVGHDLRFWGRCARVPVIDSGQIPMLLHILRRMLPRGFAVPIDWARCVVHGAYRLSVLHHSQRLSIECPFEWFMHKS